MTSNWEALSLITPRNELADVGVVVDTECAGTTQLVPEVRLRLGRRRR
jgi:hypothetical protein